jgi:hypothetical protein
MPDRYGDIDDGDELVEPVEPDPRQEPDALESALERVRQQRSHLTVVQPARNKREAQEEARRQRVAVQQAKAMMRDAGISRCRLCDDDGYTKNGCVCDHVDRRETYARGRYLVRNAMGWQQSTGTPMTAKNGPSEPAQRRTVPSEPNPTRKRSWGAQEQSQGASC